MALNPRDSARLIANAANYVRINKEGVQKVATLIQQSVAKNEFSIKTWKSHDLNPKVADSKAIDWIFLVNTLNFSFWTKQGESNKLEITLNGKTYTGYYGLCAAINRALKAGIPVCNADFYAKVSMEELKDIMKSDSGVEMPLIPERLQVLHETGSILLKKFDGSFSNCINESKGNAERLLKLIVENFPSYRDEADFEGRRVSLYKRAQILIGDIWGCFEGQDMGSFGDINTITMFADYRVPQVLNHFGALEYNDELLNDLKAGTDLPNGCRKEVEIRGCSIWAVEEICSELQKRGCNMNSILVDYYLWDLRRLKSQQFEATPFHQTRCIYY